MKLEKYMADANILGIIIYKFYYKKKMCPIILFKVDKSQKIGLYNVILSFNLAFCL